MIKLACSIPNKITLACSGGSDSMVFLDFLLKGRKEVRLAYFNHGTDHGDEAEDFLKSFCENKGLSLAVGRIDREKSSEESPEEYWRNQRMEWFHSLNTQVITAHHLDDAVEWWVFSSLNGMGKLIPLRNNNITRPFLLTPKKEIVDWAERKNVTFLKDPSNKKLKYARNRIRHNLMPEILKINPGIHSLVRKKLEYSFMQYISEQRRTTRPVC